MNAFMTSKHLASESLEATHIQQVLEGDPQLFRELVKPHRRGLFQKALSITGCSADAEEVVQTAMMNAFRKLHSFRRESRLYTWLTRITINEARRVVRKKLRRKEEPLEWDDFATHRTDSGFTDTQDDPHQTLEIRQLRLAIVQALADLPHRYHEPFVLRYMQHFSIADAARALDISESCFKSRLHRSRMKMRAALAHWCFKSVRSFDVGSDR